MNRMHNSQFRMMVAYFTLAVSVIGFYWIVTNLEMIGSWVGWVFTVMSPFIAGFIIAYILSIPVNALMRLLHRTKIEIIRSWRKTISVITVYLLFVFVIYTALRLLVPLIIIAVVDLVSSLPYIFQQLLIGLEEFMDDTPFYWDMESFANEFFGEDFNVNNPWGLITYDAILSYLATIMGGATALFRGFLAFISSIYFLFEGEGLGRFLTRLLNAFLSKRAGSRIMDYGQRINQYFKKYLFCLICDAIIMAFVGTILLTILGSPFAILLGLLIGTMNLIPYFGSIISSAIAVVVVWVTQGSAMGAVSAVVLLSAQQMDANVIQPRLYGTSLKLSPLLVIISVTVGGAVGGVIGGGLGGNILGMVVAIPTAKVLMNILDDMIEHREATKHGEVTLDLLR